MRQVSLRAIIQVSYGDGDLRGKEWEVHVPDTPVTTLETERDSQTTISRTVLGFVQAETGTQDRKEAEDFSTVYHYLVDKHGRENIHLTDEGVKQLDREGTSITDPDGGLTPKQARQVSNIISQEMSEMEQSLVQSLGGSQ